MNLFDFDHPFYRPLWIRGVVVAVAAGWGVFEFVSGSPFWGVLFCGMAAFAFHGLFIRFNPRQDAPDKQGKDDENGKPAGEA